MRDSEFGGRGAAVENGLLWNSGAAADLWISCHGYESRSVKHLDLPPLECRERFSLGFDFPTVDDGPELADRLRAQAAVLAEAGLVVETLDDAGFLRRLRAEVDKVARTLDRPLHLVADISSMNRSRIAALLLTCASKELPIGCDLDLVYFPSTFESHKHEYEPLEAFSPVHERVAGWPVEPDFPIALVVGLGTEPRRAEGIVESLEPDILSLFEPVGDEASYADDLRIENRRVLEVGGEPIPYELRDPQTAYELLLTNVERLAERARVVVVPLGPKIFAALAMNVALQTGPQVGVWKASAGRGVQPIDVHGVEHPVLARFSFPPLH